MNLLKIWLFLSFNAFSRVYIVAHAIKAGFPIIKMPL